MKGYYKMQKIYCGGQILTMLNENKYVEAILISDGKIIGIGSEEEIFNIVENREYVDKINLNGQTLMPSFIDPHSHVSMVAQTAFMANLSECKSFIDIKNTLIEYKKKNSLGETDPIIGFGYDHNFLTEEAHPTKDI